MSLKYAWIASDTIRRRSKALNIRVDLPQQRTRLIVFFATSALMLLVAQPVRATSALLSDAAFAQSAMVDLTIAGIVSDLGGPIDYNASFHYDGLLNISESADGSTVGSFSGHLAGTYRGQPVTGDFAGTLEPVTLVDPDFDGTGSASEPGTGNKLDVNLHVKVDDANNTAAVSGTVGKDEAKGQDLKKTHDAETKKTTYDGSVKFKGKDYILTIKVDDNPGKDGKKHYSSQLYDHFSDYSNSGTISLSAFVPPTGQDYAISIDVGIVPTPEPCGLGLLGLGTVGLFACRSRRLRAGHRSDPSRKVE